MSIHSLSESRFWLIDGTPVSILPPCELADVRRAFPKAATITPEEGLKEEIVRQFKERKQ